MFISDRDNRIIKASFRGNPVQERATFSQSICLLPISVGQAIHEGEKFIATLKLINSSFKACTILVDDSVQRHTIGIINDLSQEKLYKMAVEEGVNWLNRNDKNFALLTIPYTIMRWDDWYNHPSYIQNYLRVVGEYDNNKTYREEINANVEDFLTRFIARFSNIKINYQRASKLCLDYLFEECAVMCLWVDRKYTFEVYPSGRNKAMAATYKYLIEPTYPQYLRPVALRFKKYPLKSNLMEMPLYPLNELGLLLD